LRYLIPLFLLSLLLACREEKSIWDSLTQEEKDEITQMATAKCQSEKQSTYERFKRLSNEVFTSTAPEYAGGKNGFIYEYKSGDTLVETIEIRTWKRTTTEYIFYIIEKPQHYAQKEYFLRIGKAINEEMIDDLLLDHCNQDPARRIKVSGTDAGPLTVTNTFKKGTASGGRIETSFIYSYAFNRLAYFSRFIYNFKSKEYDAKNKEITSQNKDYTSTFKTKEFEKNLVLGELNTLYCDIEAVRPYKVQANEVSYKMDCSSNNTGWNL
jgi:hypothetical protein